MTSTVNQYDSRYRESPDVLEDGRWVRSGHILVWEEA